MKNRLLTVGIAAPAAVTMVLALGACASSSTVAGKGGHASSSSVSSSDSQGGGSSSTSAPTSSAPSSSASSNSSPALSLAAKLGQGVSHATSAHLTLAVNAGPESIIGRGDEQLSGGKLVALDLTETVAKSIALRLVIVNGKSYIRLPSTLNKSGKPWQLVSANSKSKIIQTLAGTLASTQSSASLGSVTTLVSAARSVKQTSGTMYTVDVDPTKLPANYQGKQALIASGLTSIPLTITLDSAGRPVRVSEKLTVSGTQVNTLITVGSYNKPVHVTAPPASQVSTR